MMDWLQVFTIIGILGGIMFWFMNRIEKDINRLDADLRLHITTSSQRIDQLYVMFVDLLKEGKK